MGKFWGVLGALLAGLAVILGAFAAHGLNQPLALKYGSAAPKMVAGQPVPAAHKALADFKTGAEYQFFHALGILFVGVYLGRSAQAKTLLNVAGGAFFVGILLFSGSLYLLVLLNEPRLGMVAPIGGTAMIVGWVCLALGIRKS